MPQFEAPEKIDPRSTRRNIFQLLFVIFGALITLVVFFIFTSDSQTRCNTQEAMLKRLYGVARSAAYQIDGNRHQRLAQKYQEKGAISKPSEDSAYLKLHKLLSDIHGIHGLESDIYTLVPETTAAGDTVFEFIGTSSESPYFRHRYTNFPPEILEKYKQGGKLAPYESENGHWLSAFAPIRNSEGEVVAVVEVDEKFDAFLEQTTETMWDNIWASLAALVVIGGILTLFIRRILNNEKITRMLEQQHQEILERNEEINQQNLQLEDRASEIERQRNLVQKKNQSLTSSINYASRIQQAMLPDREPVERSLGPIALFYKPRDIVSGDYYWFYETLDSLILVAADCTGHGVPGALMSMLGLELLEKIVGQYGITDPGEILTELHQDIRTTLKQDSQDNRDGMDVAVVQLEKDGQSLAFAGAKNPLFVVYQNGQTQLLKGDKNAVGGHQKEDNRSFTTQHLEIKEPAYCFIYSDGFQDQYSQSQGRKFMSKRFREYLVSIAQLPAPAMEKKMATCLENWQEDTPQTDDILVIGFPAGTS